MTDEYSSIAREVSASTNVEGSKFIASAFPVTSAAEAEALLTSVRRTYHDATHHCFAFALGPGRREVKSSDAGEPSGTGGVKILAAIEAHGLSDILVVVTRYFGGKKLGTGGLGRAYREAADKALAAGKKTRRLLLQPLTLTFPYEVTRGIMRVVNEFRLRIVETTYGDDVTLTLAVRPAESDRCLAAFSDATRGNCSVRLGPQYTSTV